MFDQVCAADRHCTHLNNQSSGCIRRSACVRELFVNLIFQNISDYDEVETFVKLAYGEPNL